jgi:Fic family protein
MNNKRTFDEQFKHCTIDNYFTNSNIENRETIEYSGLLSKIKEYREKNKNIIFRYEDKEFYIINMDKVTQISQKIEVFSKEYNHLFSSDELDELFTLEGYSSSTIEGANSTLTTIKLASKKTSNEEMIFSNLEALEVYKKKNDNLSKELICDIHKIISKNNMDKEYLVGEYRKKQNEIRNSSQKPIYNPPNVSTMNKMMEALFYFMDKDKTNNLNKIILFHFLFAFIHPFDDGNGRCVRVLSSYLFKKYGYDILYYAPLSIAIHKSLKKYYDSFLNVERSDIHRKTFDMTYFYHYILDILEQTISSFEDKIKTKFGVNMKKATTLDEMYDSFEGSKPLSENEYDSFYVPIYDKKIKKFISNMKKNKVYEKIFFIAGQRGNGKSTILNILKKENKGFDKYDIKHIEAKEVFGYEDVNIIDILIITALYLIDKSDDNKKDLRDRLKIELEELAKINNKELERTTTRNENTKTDINIQAQIKVGLPTILKSILPVDIKASGHTSYTMNDIMRKELKEIYKINKKKLVAIVNNVISLCKKDKDILLIIDGLEKIPLDYQENIKILLTQDIGLLKDLKCFKIFTIPIYLKEQVNQIDIKVLDFTMELDENKNIKNLNEHFQDVIKKRINESYIDSLISKEAITLAIENSAGNVRLLLHIIQESIIVADVYEENSIKESHIKEACLTIGGNMSTTAQLNKTFLNKIKNNNTISNNDKDKEILEKMIQSGLVFAYCNGKTLYKVNPTIKESLED